MRKIKHLTALALTAVMFFTVSCVENEVSESVKNLRELNTELIEAKTNQLNMEARAQAMYDSIQNEMKMAELEIEKAKADYEAAEYENEKALLELELEAAQMEQQQMIAEAEVRMTWAERDLEQATRELEEQIAASEVSNPALDEYMDKYSDAATDVKNTRSQILSLQREIAEAQVTNEYVGFNGTDSSLIALNLDQLERELANLEDWKAKYEEVADDPSTMSAALNDAQASLEEINAQVDEKDREVSEAWDLYQEKDDAYDDVRNEYYTARSDSFDVFVFTYEYYSSYYYPRTISGDYLEEILNDPGHGNGDYYSIEYYDDEIANSTDQAYIEEMEEEKAVVEAYINMIHEEYGGDVYSAVDALTDEYFAAKDAMEEAQDAYNALDDELTQLQAEQTYMVDYVDALENDRDALVANLDGIKEDIEDVKNEITEIENNVESWEDYIDHLEDNLATLQEELELHQAQMDEYKQLIDQELSEE